MPTRVIQFTDTGEWYAGTRSKDELFSQPLGAWATRIGQAHGRPAEGFEFDDPADDPRAGVLVEDAPTPAPDTEGAPLTPEENKQLRALLRNP
jgi:hypothetical protein